MHIVAHGKIHPDGGWWHPLVLTYTGTVGHR